jgi:hypothetical protein
MANGKYRLTVGGSLEAAADSCEHLREGFERLGDLLDALENLAMRTDQISLATIAREACALSGQYHSAACSDRDQYKRDLMETARHA